ncbi:MAG: hypothetical protein M1825_002381 [Sarcosagium campestre]|nr:MAG: hypothetical protein M1825_002381 [Sarcosagium campestre]
MKRPAPPYIGRRSSSTLHYQTFPVRPPSTRGRPPPAPVTSGADDDDFSAGRTGSGSSGHHHGSPLPVKQLVVLAVISLAEQTALNSISPYLPEMASSFPEVDISQVGLYVGLIASAFALAQFVTGFFWGWLSDQIGRKPVILVGTLLTAACFIAFGFCRTLWQAILVQVFMGLVNGNQGVVSTCLGEITDRSNQSRAFVYLPVVYGLGAITGPIAGGLLVSHRSLLNKHKQNPYPYLAPNLLSAGILIVDLCVAMFFLEESLEEARDLPPLGKRLVSLFTWMWQFTSSTRPSYLKPSPTHARGESRSHGNGAVDIIEEGDEGSEDSTESGSPELSMPSILPEQHMDLKVEHIYHRNTVLLLASYTIFQLSNISFNSLFPIFASSPAPTGRDLSPKEIGLLLAFAGAVTIAFQVGIFGKLIEKMGNKTTYRVGLAGFTLAFLIMPWVGYAKPAAHHGINRERVSLWIEVGIVLLIKTVAAVGGLTSALLLITNSAPNHSVLGTLNGLAQTLSAAGRAIGPFLSGGLFSVATHVRPKGEALAWGVFGGVAFVGFCMSFGIRGAELEADGWDEEEEVGDEDDDTDSENGSHDGIADGQAQSSSETQGLLSRQPNKK